MVRACKPLTPERLKTLLHYDPGNGVFCWRVQPTPQSKRRAGDIAGCRSGNYWVIKIDGRQYLGHRLAFLYAVGRWPSGCVDHRDCDGLNNRWANLREATYSDNQANRGKPIYNSSGFKGVSLDRVRGTWRATIEVRSVSIFLGRFRTPELAHLAYTIAAAKHFGQFARAA